MSFLDGRVPPGDLQQAVQVLNPWAADTLQLSGDGAAVDADVAGDMALPPLGGDGLIKRGDDLYVDG